MVPIPAGPKITDITKLGRRGSSTLKTNMLANQIIPPSMLLVIIFLRKNITNIEAIIRTIPIPKTRGLRKIGVAVWAAL